MVMITGPLLARRDNPRVFPGPDDLDAHGAETQGHYLFRPPRLGDGRVPAAEEGYEMVCLRVQGGDHFLAGADDAAAAVALPDGPQITARLAGEDEPSGVTDWLGLCRH